MRPSLTNEIRREFLEYFSRLDHKVIKSSPLIPADDPTLLFTNAGMVQFKKVFTGEEKRDYTRAVTCQKCIRAGGKHNDLENVGYTSRHHTFFEMLGNFSFGDYFKEDAIKFAWDFITNILQLPRERIWITVFKDDDEAEELWKKISGLTPSRIVRMSEKDNFWQMGDTGPCGPCSEIIFDQGEDAGCKRTSCSVGCDCDRFLEIWNLVFMEFNRDSNGHLTPLPKKNIDTGMGLERIAAVCQGKFSNYENDLFEGIIGRIGDLAKISFGRDPKKDAAMRVIADHSRAITFLVAEGLLPSNEGQGYVLRRIMRRAIRYGNVLGFQEPFLYKVCTAVIDCMGDAYPEITNVSFLKDVVENEEKRFSDTLRNGLMLLENELETLKAKSDTISGEFIFKLYDTYGFPVDIVRDIAIERGFKLDLEGYEREMQKQRERSRKAQKEKISHPYINPDKYPETRFCGYETTESEACIISILTEKGEVSTTEKDAIYEVILDTTPFYAESGGQIGDTGEIIGKNGHALVLDTKKVGNLHVHKVKVLEGSLRQGEIVNAKVDVTRRRSIMRNHTATHLLHRALRLVLGEHVRQAGSLVSDERLRFDFSHFGAIEKEKLNEIERIINDVIMRDIEVEIFQTTLEEAERLGAMALFGDKYGEQVRVVKIGDFSMELCGGTHCKRTGEIGLLKILSEGAISAGFRRIEAITGFNLLEYVSKQDEYLDEITQILKCTRQDAASKIIKLQERIKQLEKGDTSVGVSIEDILKNEKVINGIKLVTYEFNDIEVKRLREYADKVRDKIKSGVVVFGTRTDGKAQILVALTKDLTEKYRADEIARELSKFISGSGGGRPDFAQAGGTNPEGLSQALNHAEKILSPK